MDDTMRDAPPAFNDRPEYLKPPKNIQDKFKKDLSPIDPVVALLYADELPSNKFYKEPTDAPETLEGRSHMLDSMQRLNNKRELKGLGAESEWQKLVKEVNGRLKKVALSVSKVGMAWLIADALARMASANEGVSLKTVAAPIIEPPEISAAVDSRTAAVIAETKKVIAAVGKADLGETARPVIKVSGSPTVYNLGVWEKVINNRLKGSKNLPPLNPELNGNSEVMELITNHQVVAVNPASFDSEYGQLVRTIIKSAEKQKLTRGTLIKTLNTNPKLRELANKLIGQIIYLKLPNGSFQKMVIMDTLGSGDSLSTPSGFTADFDQRFLEDIYRIVWDGKQYIDKDTGKPVKDLPAVSLYG